MKPTRDPALPISAASERDLRRIQLVHQAAFPEFFLSRMGGWFLRTYYATILSYEHGRIFAAWQDEQLVGFVGAFRDPAAFCEHMASRRMSFLGPTLLGVARRPQLLPRVLFNRARVLNYHQDSPVPSARQIELASIGVSPVAGKKGVGASLMEAVREYAQQQNAEEIVLTTDAEANEAVNRFYLKLGYEFTGTFRSGAKRYMNGYRLRLKP